MSSAVYFDSHMHTPLCKHAAGEPEEYAEQALKRGLAGIIFTCHSPMPRGFWPSVRMSESELETYIGMVERCRQRYEGQLEIRLGMETDYFPGFEEWAESLHRRAPFHYCLGSVHWQGPEYHERFEGWNHSAFHRSYWQNLAASAETGLFDCLAHPDLIKNHRSTTWNFADWNDDVVAALERIAKTGVCMELNTSGMNKHYPEMNPGPAMLRMMHERGIRVVLGSDSHTPRRVGDQFIAGLETLQKVGYTEISVFRNRKRIDLPISTVLPQLIAVTQQPDDLGLFASAA